MSARTKLRDDFDAVAVRGLAKASREADQTRRLMTLASIYDGVSHLEAARIGGVGAQIIRDWIVRFNARGPEGLRTGRSAGQASKLTDDLRGALVKRVEDGPDPAVDGVVRWRLKDLTAWLEKHHGVSLDEMTVSRALKALGYRKLSARPRHHAQEAGAVEDFKKPSRPRWQPSRPSFPRRM